MNTPRLSRKIVTTLVRDRLYYPDRLLLDTVGIIARYGVLLILYWYVYQVNGGSINDTSFEIVAWSMFGYFSFSVLRLRDISREIMRDIRSGNVEILLSKPLSYLGYRLWWQVGAGLYPFLVISLVGTLTLAFFVGIPSTMTISLFLPSVSAVVFLGVLLSLYLYTIVGLLAFWIEDINPVYWIVDKAVMILGGSYLPVALFPPLMYKLALYSPFGASQFITHTVYEEWASEWAIKLGIQFGWVLICVLVMLLIFARAKQHVSINGG